jgi:predicted permease
VLFRSENVLTIPIALAVAESEAHAGAGLRDLVTKVGARLARNPMILAIVVGMLVSSTGVGLPAVLAKPIDMLAAASGATALFVIGGALAGGDRRDLTAEMLLPVLGKLLLHPLVTIGLLTVVSGIAHDLRLSLMILTASPMLTIYALLGRPFGRERICAAALLAATVASFFTLTALLWAVGGDTIVR